MSNLEFIKDSANNDFRRHIPGVLCNIKDCKQYVGFGAVLKVSPVNTSALFYSKDGKDSAVFNVALCNTSGVYGFSSSIKDTHYAYVICDDPTRLDGRPALLVPKTFLYPNRESTSKTEPDEIDQEELKKKFTMVKEVFIKSRKFR